MIHNNLTGIKRGESLEDRLRRRFEVDENGCWNFTGPLNCWGYGIAYWKGHRTRLAHRLSYLLFVGDVPEGTEIDHLCRNRRCCNPDHLEAVPHIVNVYRGDAMLRPDLCAKGHVMDGYNVKYDKRYCKTCKKVRLGRGI